VKEEEGPFCVVPRSAPRKSDRTAPQSGGGSGPAGGHSFPALSLSAQHSCAAAAPHAMGPALELPRTSHGAHTAGRSCALPAGDRARGHLGFAPAPGKRTQAAGDYSGSLLLLRRGQLRAHAGMAVGLDAAGGGRRRGYRPPLPLRDRLGRLQDPAPTTHLPAAAQAISQRNHLRRGRISPQRGGGCLDAGRAAHAGRSLCSR
jgi:hypothetical protein